MGPAWVIPRAASPMDVAFVAQTESCTYLLDPGGICRWVVLAPSASEEVQRLAQRCIGAQYVAALDPSDAAVLVHDPKPGRALVFARVAADGRVSLLRSGTLLVFSEIEEANEGAEAKEVDDLTLEREAPATVSAPPEYAAAVAEEQRHEDADGDEPEETVPFSRERPSAPKTLRAAVPPPANASRRGVLPRRHVVN